MGSSRADNIMACSNAREPGSISAVGDWNWNVWPSWAVLLDSTRQIDCILWQSQRVDAVKTKHHSACSSIATTAVDQEVRQSLLKRANLPLHVMCREWSLWDRLQITVFCMWGLARQLNGVKNVQIVWSDPSFLVAVIDSVQSKNWTCCRLEHLFQTPLQSTHCC